MKPLPSFTGITWTQIGRRTTYVVNQVYIFPYHGAITIKKKNLFSPFSPTLKWNRGVNGFFCPVSLKIYSWALLFTASASIYPSMKHLLPCWDVLWFATNPTLPGTFPTESVNQITGEMSQLFSTLSYSQQQYEQHVFLQGRLGRGSANETEASES